MSALILWRSEAPDGAERASRILLGLSGPAREDVHDAALVCWPRGTGKPRTRVLPELASDEALGDGFWGVLFSLIFYSPLLGAAVVSNGEAFSGSIADFGITDTFVNRVRDSVTPGTSALFLLGSDALVDHLRDLQDADHRTDLLITRMDPRQEVALRQVFVG